MAKVNNSKANKFYLEQGYYLHHHPIFSDVKFNNLTKIFEDLNEKNKSSKIDLMDTPHFSNSKLLDYLLDEQVLDLVENFIGPNIGLWSSHFISKEPFKGKVTPWHEDTAYWKGRFDKMDKIVTIWLAIDDTDKENGCMKVIPKSHLNVNELKYENVNTDKNIFNEQIVSVNESNAVYLGIKKGHCSLHDGRIVHGAEGNESSRRRCGYTMRYFSQSMKYDEKHPYSKGYKLWHCRGTNFHNNPVEN
ncbi:MAG: phytanoyl-CoA dioxygenase family protein [Melioribacteraceae bacterium]